MPSQPHSAKLVGARFRAVRQILGLTQDAMAKYQETSRAQISQWETGAQRVPFPAAIRLKVDYGVTLDFLYAGDLASVKPDLAIELQRLLAS